jgi:hypothetical protein
LCLFLTRLPSGFLVLENGNILRLLGFILAIESDWKATAR